MSYGIMLDIEIRTRKVTNDCVGSNLLAKNWNAVAALKAYSPIQF